MKIVYHAESIIDAQLARDALQAEGIAASVSGEHLTAGVGELPFGGLVKVWVGDDAFDQARPIVVEWERRLLNGEFACADDDEATGEDSANSVMI